MTSPDRDQIHRTIAMHVRNRTTIRFTAPDHDAGPTHARDGDSWVIRLSPSEADAAARAAIGALEELGLIPLQQSSRAEEDDSLATATGPIQVTAHNPTSGETRTVDVQPGDYVLICHDPCRRARLSADSNGTHVITVTGIRTPMAGLFDREVKSS